MGWRADEAELMRTVKREKERAALLRLAELLDLCPRVRIGVGQGEIDSGETASEIRENLEKWSYDLWSDRAIRGDLSQFEQWLDDVERAARRELQEDELKPYYDCALGRECDCGECKTIRDVYCECGEWENRDQLRDFCKEHGVRWWIGESIWENS